VTTLRARRTELQAVDASLKAALRTTAAREGALHAADDLVLCAFGVAASLELDAGLGSPSAPLDVGGLLGSIELLGDEGPGGSGVLALGALPFDPAAPSRLFVPSLLCAWRPDGASMWVTQVSDVAFDDPQEAMERLALAAPVRPLPRLGPLTEVLSRADYAAAVDVCVARLREGAGTKVVLARSVTANPDGTIDAAALAEALHDTEPTCTVYAYPSGSARFVGATPELLVSTSDGAVTAHPHAGTVGLRGTADDAARIAWLAGSSKNHLEHAVVVHDIVERLTPLCDTISAPDEPVVVELTAVAHLGTWVDGKLLGPRNAETAMRALAALHPTPAVGGVPRDMALATITELERSDRGAWAGPVGWVDADGTSSWVIGIRGILVSPTQVEVWAGAGIVADSVGVEELDETDVKLDSVLRVLPR
jgi:isochorismate synthase